MKSIEEYLNYEEPSVEVKFPKEKADEEKNFSGENGIQRGVLVTFSCTNSELIASEPCVLEGTAEGAQLLSFSGNNDFLKEYEDTILTSFSVGFVQYLQERKKPARESLKRRINQVIAYIKSKSYDECMKVRKDIISYIYSFILDRVQRYAVQFAKQGAKEGKDDEKAGANLILALGLGNFITDRKAVGKLQMALRMVAPQIAREGAMQKQTQLRVKQGFGAVFNDMLKTIEDKYLPADKKGVLTGKPTKATIEHKEEESKETQK